MAADLVMHPAVVRAPGQSTFVTSTRETDIPAILQPLEIRCPNCGGPSEPAAECPTAVVVYSVDTLAFRPTKTTEATTATTTTTAADTASLTDMAMAMDTATATVATPQC